MAKRKSKSDWEIEFEWDQPSFEDRVWGFLTFLWRMFQIFIVFCLFVGLAVSQQCQNQVQEACEIIKLCD